MIAQNEKKRNSSKVNKIDTAQSTMRLEEVVYE
jgi:hypothetical protein